tara:strand:+ start:892 stop:1254 length:363 start_codon:yes stop_codon:yes gene_type:complete
MAWKDIVKIDTEEAQRLGRKYARDEMNLGDVENLVRRQKEAIPRLKQILSNIKSTSKILQVDHFTPNSLTHNQLMSADWWLNQVGVSPPPIKSNMGSKEVIEILEKYISDIEKAHKRHGY